MRSTLLLGLSALFIACGGGEAAAPTGCCQVDADSCSSPVTEQECTDTGGASFHEGGTCRSDGRCGVLHE